MKRSLFLLLCVCCVTGCATAIPAYKDLTQADNPEIAVLFFNTIHAEGEYKGGTDFGQVYAQNVAAYMQKLNYKAFATDKNDVSTVRYIIEGSFSQIEPGSFAKRYWVGMGAGAARMTMSAKLIRVKDNYELGLHQESITSINAYKTEDILKRISAKLAQNLAREFSMRIQQDGNKTGAQE